MKIFSMPQRMLITVFVFGKVDTKYCMFLKFMQFIMVRKYHVGSKLTVPPSNTLGDYTIFIVNTNIGLKNLNFDKI